MNGGGCVWAGKQLFGRRPVGRAQGARRVRQQHTAARSTAGGSGPVASSSGSSSTGAGSAAGSRFGWATKWVLLPAAASALFGGKAAADAYSSVQTQLDVEAGHKRAERRQGMPGVAIQV